MSKKGAIELSINFVVVLILAIATFAGGLYITKEFFTQASAMKKNIDDRTDTQIESLLDDGRQVALPVNKKTAIRDENTIFGLGILNTLRDPAIGTKFKVVVVANAAFDKQNNDMITPAAGSTGCKLVEYTGNTANMPLILAGNKKLQQMQSWLVYNQGPYTIKPNEKEKVPIGIIPKGACSGTYIYDMYVCKDDGASTPDVPDCSIAANSQYIYGGSLQKMYVQI